MGFRSDKRTLKGLRQGSRETYEHVISLNYESIYRLMLYLTADTTLAEDLTQETFTSAWARLDHFEAKASVKTWLHKIAYHKFIDSKRASARGAQLLAQIKPLGSGSSQASNPFLCFAADEDTKILLQALNSLPSPDYTAIVLHYINGLTFRQMAAVLDRPVGSVKWQTSRALKQLRTTLSDRIEQ